MRNSRIAAPAICSLAFTLVAQTRPDFTGEWRELGGAGAVLQIDHRDPVMIEARDGGGEALFYSTDNVERQGVRALWVQDGAGSAVLEKRRALEHGLFAVERYQIAAPGRLAITLQRDKGAPERTEYEMVPLSAGAARADITPAAPMPQYGYANRRCGPVSMGTHDRLWAKALVLASARNRLAIVTLDLGSIVSDRLQERVARELGIPTLLLAASHTHSAPNFLPPSATGPAAAAYLAELEDKIFAAVRQARDSAQPARLRVGRGAAQLGYNRLVRREHGRARAVFDNLERVPFGPVDPEFQLLEVTGPDGRPKALLVHYAVHAVVLGPSNCHYSADYPGVLQSTIEASVPGVQAMFVQGGAGDINPLFLARKGIADEDFAQVTRMGELLAAEVLKARSSLSRLEPASAAIHARQETLEFADRWEGKERAPHRIGIATVLIGRDIAIAATPGEPLHKLQTRWKQEADVAFPLFYGYTFSGTGAWPGYLPDLRSAAYGGYGADNQTRVEPGAGDAILGRHLRNLYGLRGMWRAAQGLP